MTILQYIDELAMSQGSLTDRITRLSELRSDLSPSELVIAARLEDECLRLLLSNPAISSEDLRHHLINYFAN